MNKSIIVSIFFAVGIIIYGGYASRCHGEECGVKIDQKIINKRMNPENILTQVSNKEVILLDVREDSEWQEGHIAGAVHIPLGDLSTDATDKLPKNMPVYIYCRSGNRAGQAESILKQMGYENVLNIGGINEWRENGGQLVQ